MILGVCLTLFYFAAGYIIVSECCKPPDENIYFSPVDNLE